ncbi:unnamed protein product [Macrosiphum euphorbiae]|uniref:Uncharacterized protein n=1 Tax=Macrosiphum euphorbiae TaxID=13131 RepID=A0AAV0XF28_9HEMI|nr:unnamed protein product [Macrosiphum euphorbiae]
MENYKTEKSCNEEGGTTLPPRQQLHRSRCLGQTAMETRWYHLGTSTTHIEASNQRRIKKCSMNQKRTRYRFMWVLAEG